MNHEQGRIRDHVHPEDPDGGGALFMLCWTNVTCVSSAAVFPFAWLEQTVEGKKDTVKMSQSGR